MTAEHVALHAALDKAIADHPAIGANGKIIQFIIQNLPQILALIEQLINANPAPAPTPAPTPNPAS
jgi:hypothetical protein